MPPPPDTVIGLNLSASAAAGADTAVGGLCDGAGVLACNGHTPRYAAGTLGVAPQSDPVTVPRCPAPVLAPMDPDVDGQAPPAKRLHFTPGTSSGWSP